MKKQVKISIIITTALIVLLSAILGIYFGVFHNGKHKSIFDMTDREIRINYKDKIIEMEKQIYGGLIDVPQNAKYVKLNITFSNKFDDPVFIKSPISNKLYKTSLVEKVLSASLIDTYTKEILSSISYNENEKIWFINKLIDVENVSGLLFLKASYAQIDIEEYRRIAFQILQKENSTHDETELKNIASKMTHYQKDFLGKTIENNSYAISK